tara:strand:- start:347 stop:634 length:288 start_codon:yes stop_codon:yes gene_type:complete
MEIMTEQQRKSMEEEKYLKMIRDSEDFHDTIDSERETREELVERQKIMDESRIERKPIHELYKGLNQRVDLHKTKVTGMGGHQMKDSDRFNKGKK